jgi:exonuclease VII small subunit
MEWDCLTCPMSKKECVECYTKAQATISDLTARLETTELALRDKAFEASDTAIKLAKAEMQLAEANEWYAKSQAYTTEVQKDLATAQAQVKRLGEAVEDLSLAYKGTVMTDRQVFAWDTIKAALANEGREGE